MNDLPTRCIDPIIKDCKECKWGQNIYPSWVETKEDLYGCTFETICVLGFDKGRPEGEPTDEEIREYKEWCTRGREEGDTN